MANMTNADLSEVEALLKKRFNKEEADKKRVQSTAAPATGSTRLDQLVLPDAARPKMPLTKGKYLVRDNPQEVQWERETRKFLVRLSTVHEHRVSAIMVYEWATGINVQGLYLEGGNANSDLRKINKILKFYFGVPFSTYIVGRKVPRAYNVRGGYFITRHRPMTLTLWAEYGEGVLHP